MNCTHVLQVSGLVGDLVVLSLQKSVRAFSINRIDNMSIQRNSPIVWTSTFFYNTNFFSYILGDQESRSDWCASFKGPQRSVLFLLQLHNLPVFTTHGSSFHLPTRNIASYHALYQLPTIKVLVVRSVHEGVEDGPLLSTRALLASGDYLCHVKLHIQKLWTSS